MLAFPFSAGAQLRQRVIFDTDMGNDVDDALAMDMLFKYADSKRISILGVAINKPGRYPVEFMDILRTWYGYRHLPIGRISNGADCENDAINYAKAVCLEKDAAGRPMFRRSGLTFEKALESFQLYRKLLAKQPDHSVMIISTGFSTNLARLMESGADKYSKLTGMELIKNKVKLLVTMAGHMGDPSFHEFNVVKDIASAKKVFEHWPTPVVTSPFDVGMSIMYPGSSIENDFGWASHHPMVEAYKSYLKMPYDRATWDLTAVLYAVEGAKYFTLSPEGTIKVTDKGATIFTPVQGGNRRYLKVDREQAGLIREHFINVIRSKPKKYQ